jgi:hypothetical protein
MFSKQFQNPNQYESILGVAQKMGPASKEAPAPGIRDQFSMMNRVPMRERSILDPRGNLSQDKKEDQVTKEFFSNTNAASLLVQVQTEIRKLSDGEISIPLQNEKQLLAVMNFIYETQRGAAIESHLSANQQVRMLNNRVLLFVVPYIHSESLSYSSYIQKQNELIQPMDRPTQSDRDFKQLPGWARF